jgi:hypothetical protein
MLTGSYWPIVRGRAAIAADYCRPKRPLLNGVLIHPD